MLTNGIFLRNFNIKKSALKPKKILNLIFKENDHVLMSLKKGYKISFSKKNLYKHKKFSNLRLIGIGGSILGAQAIYNFLKHKIKKNVIFVDNLQLKKKTNKKKYLNLVVSKSGNTIETIVNSNIYIKKNDNNIFITENKKSYIHNLGKKLKAEIIHHNNFIGGRYSVLSEVGMVPAELMGLSSNKFKQFNLLIKNKKFLNSLIDSAASHLYFIKKRKFNSVILNYDESSDSLLKWYQQLIAESLGKNKVGLLPIISNMPKDNHSVMQLYLDGFQNNFFTFFYVKEKNSDTIKNNTILPSHNYLKNKNIMNFIYAQKKATEKVFIKKKLPFRSFEIKERNEKTLGELFTFFILETILIGKCLKINPFDQPAVELIKKETNNRLI